MTMRPTVVERRSFVGNGAYVPDGTTIPENVLIGVLSRAHPTVPPCVAATPGWQPFDQPACTRNGCGLSRAPDFPSAPCDAPVAG